MKNIISTLIVKRQQIFADYNLAKLVNDKKQIKDLGAMLDNCTKELTKLKRALNENTDIE